MKTPRPIAALALACSCAASIAAAVEPAEAQAPPYLPLQGYLTDEEGTPIDGDVGIRFRLYSAATGGDVLWEENQPDVNVTQGQLAVYLGDVQPLDLALFSERALVWVGIKVGDDPESTPRVQLGTAAFAAYANRCGEAETLGGRAAEEFVADGDAIPWSSISDPPPAPTWQTLGGRPSEFPPENHEHAFGDLTGVPPGLLDGDDDTHDWASITSKPSSYAPAQHTLESHSGSLPATRLSGTLDSARLEVFYDSTEEETSLGRRQVIEQCPLYTTLIGGGCDGGSGYVVETTKPYAGVAYPRAWECWFRRRSDAPSGSHVVTAWAMCLE